MRFMNHDDLRSEVESFLSETGMGPKYFGKLACGNTELVTRLRDRTKDASVTLKTAERIRAFIAERRAKREQAA